MKQKAVIRKYRMSRAEMLQNGIDLITCATRDATEFKKFGIDDVFIDTLGTDIQNLIDTPDDAEELGDQTTATSEKNKFADDVREGIRSIMIRAENKYGVDSAHYRKFGTKGLSDLTDNDLYLCGKRVIRIARLSIADLGGLTTSDIDGVEVFNNGFHNKIEEQHDAKADRDIASEGRTINENDIYDRQVKIANTGKEIWHNKSEAKYNDYVIYDTPGPKPPPPANNP